VGSRQAEHVHDYLERQRWFAGKGRDFAVERIHPLSWLSSPEAWPAVRVELITVRYADDGSSETYQLPVGYRGEPSDNMAHAYIGAWAFPELLNRPVMAYDALHDKESTSLWLAGLLAGRTLPDLAFHRLGQLDIDPEAQSLVLTAEQSNTSLVFGEATLLKVFRRVHHGPNPDIEIHEALTTGGGDNIATLHGWLDASWPDASGDVGPGDLGMFSDFFRTASNGWELAITSVRDLYAEGDLHADEVGGDFASESFRLGATTAEIHADLARVLTVDTWGSEEFRALAEAMHARLVIAAGIVPALQPYTKGLQSAFDDLAAIDERVPVQRVHGDLHLGQTMRTVAGWRIIDFEGEPAKPLVERRALDSPLRDVAGMLRSFDYAAQHLLMQSDHSDLPLPGTAPGETNQLAFRAEEWANRNRDAFCRGYARVSGIDPREQDVLLRAYETDKAVYECVYEARTRPDWIGVPLGAIERLAG
jgi:maltokinase